MPIQPSPSAETSNPLFPSFRFCIVRTPVLSLIRWFPRLDPQIERLLSLFSIQHFHTLQSCDPECPAFFAFLACGLQAVLAAPSGSLFWFQSSCHPAELIRHTRSTLQWEARRSSCT